MHQLMMYSTRYTKKKENGKENMFLVFPFTFIDENKKKTGYKFKFSTKYEQNSPPKSNEDSTS